MVGNVGTEEGLKNIEYRLQVAPPRLNRLKPIIGYLIQRHDGHLLHLPYVLRSIVLSGVFIG